jgi:hypothetical protein
MRLGHHSIASGGLVGEAVGVTSVKDISLPSQQQVVRGAIVIPAVALARRK